MNKVAIKTTHPQLKAIQPQLKEISKPIKFGRKKIALSIQNLLSQLEDDLSAVVTLEENNALLTDDLKKQQQNFNDLQNSHQKISTKYELVSRLLAAKMSDNVAFEKFKTLFNKDFIDFANSESCLQEEAKAVLMLQNIVKQLQMQINSSSLYNKNIISVGGGFSAGKSEFISSFFIDKNIKLPIGIEPVTAIPTYITSGKSNIIKGYSTGGGAIDISPELYQQLSHNFVKSFAFHLKDIMPMMAIETPIKHYDNICFVDTPGYNPADTDGFTSDDVNTAKVVLTESSSILWLIGLDSNGTIPTSDINFIENLPAGKKIYIIANKADLKSPEELAQILDVFAEILADYDINYAGISAYSSIQQEECCYRKQSLSDFLQNENKPVQIHKHISAELNDVFDMYKKAIADKIESTKLIQSNLNSIELDLLEAKIEDNKVNNRINTLKEKFKTKTLKEQLNTQEKIKSQMLEAMAEVFESIQKSSH